LGSERARWKLVAVAAAAIAVAAGATWLAPRAQPPARIVLVVVDTLRRDHLSPYGSSVATPNVAALAARGQVFENAVSSFHQTSMSMAAMFTGRTPSIETGDPRQALPWNGSTWCGMARFGSGEGDLCLPRGLPTLAERLRAAGYWTIGVTSNQFLYEPSGFSRGFDDWSQVDERKPTVGPESREDVPHPGRSRTWASVNLAVDTALGRRPTDHFFLYVHYLDVHDYRFARRTYSEAVAVMDQALGRLFGKLEKAGLLDGAVVVLTADHGERLGEAHGIPGEVPNSYGHYGNPSWQELLRIPLVVAPPVFADTQRFVRTQDLYALVQQIAGLEPGPAADTRPDELFVGELFFRTYRLGQWKATLRRSDGRAFLYDLDADPQEQHDVAESEPSRVRDFRTRLNELSRDLAAAPSARRELSDAEKQRLRSLGYLDEEKE